MSLFLSFNLMNNDLAKGLKKNNSLTPKEEENVTPYS